MKAKKLFGTDGIRGRFGEWPLTLEIISACGRAAAELLNGKPPCKVIIGRDPRASGTQIEKLLSDGLRAEGAEVYSAGIIPTPGLSYLTRDGGFSLGIMISASHNPAEDNGIKMFKGNGYKLSDREEARLEKNIYAFLSRPGRNRPTGRLRRVASKPYLDHLRQTVNGLSLKGEKIVIDCANGAVCDYAERLFGGLGAKVVVLNNRPDGANINRGCGSLHPEVMAEAVKKEQSSAGFSFDGDGDRVLMSDENGRIMDGDQIMGITARFFQKQGRLVKNTVIATSMSNLGLEKFLKKSGAVLVRTDVGDKYVLREMLRQKTNFGGEQSGHIIFLDHASTGDGMLTALQLMRVRQQTGISFSRQDQGFFRYPQLIKNVRIAKKVDLLSLKTVKARMDSVLKELGEDGRLVLRYSGTEPLARIMLEGPKKKTIIRMAEDIAEAIEEAIGINGQAGS